MESTTTGQKRSITTGLVALIVVTAVGMAVWGVRFALGLGRATNLSDAYPWGLWIGFDVVSGVALGAGAFVVAAAVYVLNLKKYEFIARPALLTGLLGYLLVVLGLLADLAKPQNIWHLIVFWNPHSVLFEVGWCVMLYTTVMALEFSPVVFERFDWKVPWRIMRAIQIPLVIIGVVLSILHQSSLGSLFLILPYRLHPLWYSPLLPVFFFISAVGVGVAMVIIESVVSARVMKRPTHTDLIAGLATTLPYILGIYFVFKVVELVVAGEIGLIFEGSLQSAVFMAEMLLGTLLPTVLLAIPRIRQSSTGLFWASLLVAGGVILNRLDVSVVGQMVTTGSYFPHWMEFTVTIGLVATGLLSYTLITRYFPVFPETIPVQGSD